MTEKRKEEYLRILKEMSTQKDVPGGFANRMYSDLRRKFPWHFLMFSWNNKSERVIEVHKRLLIEQYQAKIEILLKSELTQEDVDDLEMINQSLVKICNRKEVIVKKTKDVLEDVTFIIMDNKPNSDMSPDELRVIELINGAEPRDENERRIIKEIKRMDANGKIVWTS
jgi:hypothetical protein